jgi:hypothetical protein
MPTVTEWILNAFDFCVSVLIVLALLILAQGLEDRSEVLRTEPAASASCSSW